MTKQVLKLAEKQIQFFKEQGVSPLGRISPPDQVEFLKSAGMHELLIS
jgi:hypothetical protein